MIWPWVLRFSSSPKAWTIGWFCEWKWFCHTRTEIWVRCLAQVHFSQRIWTSNPMVMAMVARVCALSSVGTHPGLDTASHPKPLKKWFGKYTAYPLLWWHFPVMGSVRFRVCGKGKKILSSECAMQCLNRSDRFGLTCLGGKSCIPLVRYAVSCLKYTRWNYVDVFKEAHFRVHTSHLQSKRWIRA